MFAYLPYSKEVPVRRVKRWAFSLRELLNDAIGREQFTKFLEKEYSGENLKWVKEMLINTIDNCNRILRRKGIFFTQITIFMKRERLALFCSLTS